MLIPVFAYFVTANANYLLYEGKVETHPFLRNEVWYY